MPMTPSGSPRSYMTVLAIIAERLWRERGSTVRRGRRSSAPLISETYPVSVSEVSASQCLVLMPTKSSLAKVCDPRCLPRFARPLKKCSLESLHLHPGSLRFSRSFLRNSGWSFSHKARHGYKNGDYMRPVLMEHSHK